MSLSNVVFDLVSRINSETSMASVWQIYMGAAHVVGLKFGIACFYPVGKSIADTTFASQLPNDWLKNYIENNYQEVDPLLVRGQWESRAFEWSLTQWQKTSDARLTAWREDNRAAGLNVGLTIPDRRDGHLKLLAVCGETQELTVEDRALLYFGGLEALGRMHELGLREGPATRIPLTERERECIRWMTEGKSDLDIGTILGISEKTVATHIQRVKQKFGAHSRAQVIICALRQGDLE